LKNIHFHTCWQNLNSCSYHSGYSNAWYSIYFGLQYVESLKSVILMEFLLGVVQILRNIYIWHFKSHPLWQNLLTLILVFRNFRTIPQSTYQSHQPSICWALLRNILLNQSFITAFFRNTKKAEKIHEKFKLPHFLYGTSKKIFILSIKVDSQFFIFMM